MPYTYQVVINPNAIRKAQHDSGLTNQRVAEKMGVSVATYDRWKALGRVPRKRYEAFCELLGLDAAEDPELNLDPAHAGELQTLKHEIKMLRGEVRALHADMQILINTIGKD